MWRRAIWAALLITIVIGAVMPGKCHQAQIEGIGFLIPCQSGNSGHQGGHVAKLGNAWRGIGKNVTILNDAPDVEKFFVFFDGSHLGASEISPTAKDFSFWRENCRNFCMHLLDKLVIVGQRSIEKFKLRINSQITWRSIAAIFPYGADAPKNGTILILSMRGPSTPTVMDISPIARDHRQSGNISTILSSSGAGFDRVGSFLSRFGGYFGIDEAFANEPQLPNKQSQLKRPDNDQRQREESGGVFHQPRLWALGTFWGFTGGVAIGYFFLNPN